MSQNSIKILKNQSKRQKLKRIVLLSSIFLGIICSCGLLFLYLIPDNPVSYHFETESKGNVQDRDHLEDLSGVDLKTHDINQQNSFDHIFSKNTDHPHASSAQPTLPEVIKKLPSVSTHNIKKQSNSLTKIDIPKKASTKDTQQIATSVKAIPKNKVKSDNKQTTANQLTQPFKIDSIDAIILLELDMPVSQLSK